MLCLKYKTHSVCAGCKDNLGFYTNFLEATPARQEKKIAGNQCYQFSLYLLQENNQ